MACLVLLPMLCATGAQAAASAERQRLLAERRAIEARFAAEERDCGDRFAVTACVEDVRARRRAAVAKVRAQELELDDAERKRRAADRLQAIEKRRLEAQALPASASAPEAVVRRPRAAAQPAASRPAPGGGRTEEEAAAAARRASAAERRREAAEAEQAKIREREAQRERSGHKPSAPLPVPPDAKP